MVPIVIEMKNSFSHTMLDGVARLGLQGIILTICYKGFAPTELLLILSTGLADFAKSCNILCIAWIYFRMPKKFSKMPVRPRVACSFVAEQTNYHALSQLLVKLF